MKRMLQEKLQSVLPGKIEKGEPWATPESTRHTHRPAKFNVIPGDNIDDDMTHHMPLSTAGATDVTNGASYESQRKGFDYLPMDPVDDQYTGEHAVDFYGEAKGEDDAGNAVTGFAERANVMDRI